jgi:hypothetical protein
VNERGDFRDDRARPPETASQATGGAAGPHLPLATAGAAPPAELFPGLQRCAGKIIRAWFLSDGVCGHIAAADDERAAVAAGASHRLPATSAAGPVTADLAARWGRYPRAISEPDLIFP